MSAEHTPLPWANEGGYLTHHLRGQVPVRPSAHPYSTDPGGACHDEAVANAAKIVKCVNAYDGLVAALERATVAAKLLQANCEASNEGELPGWLRDTGADIRAARAVLALVKGEVGP